MDKKQAFEYLGIPSDSIERDVRRAYRAMLFELEDKGQSDPEYPDKRERLEQAFQRALEASKSNIPKETVEMAADADPEGSKKGRLLRVGLGLLGVAGIILFFRWFSDKSVDPDGDTPSDTIGMIAALETNGTGSRVVVFKPDGSKFESPGYKAGDVDKDLAWRPDGSRLLFVSNRVGSAFNIFRWDPNGNRVQPRDKMGRDKSNLWFGWETDPNRQNTALYTAGGLVFQYDQRTTGVEQLLPPSATKVELDSGDESGSVGQLEALYSRIGKSILSAKWGFDRQVVWSVMRRESDEVFVMNPLNPAVNDGKPLPMFAGKKILFDVTPDGSAVVSVIGWEFVDPTQVPEEMMKDGQPIRPFDNAVFFVPANGSEPIAGMHTKGPQLFATPPGQSPALLETSKTGPLSFGQPVVSPNGTFVLYVLGTQQGETGVKGESIIVFPIRENKVLTAPGKIAIGEVADPSWNPTSDFIAYTKRQPNGERAICTMEMKIGQVEKVITKGGDYSSPKISPQTPAAPKS